jgi:tetratricopeptide (TPR) repeat protein
MRGRLAVVVVLLCAATPAARAQSEDEKAVARQHFQKAKELHEQKRYAEAAAEYLEAYEHMPAPAFLYNAGQVYRLGGEKRKAIEYYQKYLDLEPKGEGAEDARQFIAELGAALEAEEAAARAAAPVPAAAEPGGGAAVLPGGDQGPARDSDARPGRTLMLAGLVSGGIGVAALGAAVVFAVKARSANGDLDGYRGTWTPELEDRYASGQAAERNLTVSLVVSGVALAAGGTLFVLGRREARRATTTVSAAAGTESALLLVGGSF